MARCADSNPDRASSRSSFRPMSFLQNLKDRARRLKAETLALCLAARHPQTPWYAKLLVACIVAYAFSPIA